MKTKVSREAKQKRDSGVRRHHGPKADVYGQCHSVVRVDAVPRAILVPGAVILARVPFVEADGSYKCRPVVVLHAVGAEVRVRPCTSSSTALRREDSVLIVDLAVAGLVKPTAVRGGTVTIDRCDLIAPLGRLSESDACRVLGLFATSDRVAA